MATRAEWAHALLSAGGWPDTPEHVLALVAWASAENTTADWNPLATTQREAGSTNFNPSHVQNYLSEGEGITATIETLRNGYYPEILAHLGDPNATAENIAGAVAGSPWGTGRLALELVALVRADTSSHYADTAVTGPVSAPPAPPAPTPASNPWLALIASLPQLRKGSTDPHVAQLQTLLNREGAALVVDGVFGPLTDAAVRAAQARYGIGVDGIVGPLTWGHVIAGK